MQIKLYLKLTYEKLKDLIQITEENSEEMIKNTVWSIDSKGIKDPDIFVINIEDKIIEFATIEEVKKDKDFLGEATKMYYR